MMNNAENPQITIPCVMHWVSVIEELPPVELNVLVYDGFGIYITNRLDDDCIIWDSSSQIFDDITHWAYLPDAPCA